MNKSEVAYLVAETYSQNEYGVQEKQETKRKIYAKIIVMVCNPPYIEDISTIDKKTWEQEPHLALLAKPCTFFYEQLLKG